MTVATNNTDDAKILEDRLEKLQEKTPELNEYHTEAAWPGAAPTEAGRTISSGTST